MMLSTRLYVEDRKQLEWTVNYVFMLLRGEDNHCRNNTYLEAILNKCGLCEHEDELFPFKVKLIIGNQTHDCGDLCYKCARYLQFVVSKIGVVELQFLPEVQHEDKPDGGEDRTTS